MYQAHFKFQLHVNYYYPLLTDKNNLKVNANFCLKFGKSKKIKSTEKKF